MDLLDAVLEAENQEQRAYEDGTANVATDPDVRQSLATFARDNYSRGHNAGFTCGVMVAALRHVIQPSPSPPPAAQADAQRKALDAARALLHRIEDFAAKSRNLRVAEETFGTRMVPLDDETADDAAGAAAAAAASAGVTNDASGGVSLPRVVVLAQEFVAVFGAHVAELPPLEALVPPDALAFLTSMIDYNRAVLNAELDAPIHAAMAAASASAASTTSNAKKRGGANRAAADVFDW
jgi:hypothetical protein